MNETRTELPGSPCGAPPKANDARHGQHDIAGHAVELWPLYLSYVESLAVADAGKEKTEPCPATEAQTQASLLSIEQVGNVSG